MFQTAAAARISAWLELMGNAIRVGWQRLWAVRSRRRRAEHERLLSRSADRFEVERRERAWNRWQSDDSSLLGR